MNFTKTWTVEEMWYDWFRDQLDPSTVGMWGMWQDIMFKAYWFEVEEA